jgi:hypothetical protein
MDAGRIGTFSPQEDEFAALLLGEPSLYRVFIDPRRIDQLGGLLLSWRRQMGQQQDEAPLSHGWETFLKAVLAHSPGPLLLKSPNHTFRLPWLAQRFPGARFIWLTRAADDVLASNRRMWTSMMERYSLWSHDPVNLEAFLIKAIENHDELLNWARHTLSDRLYMVKFDEVMNDPSNLVRRLVRQLGVKPK